MKPDAFSVIFKKQEEYWSSYSDEAASCFALIRLGHRNAADCAWNRAENHYLKYQAACEIRKLFT